MGDREGGRDVPSSFNKPTAKCRRRRRRAAHVYIWYLDPATGSTTIRLTETNGETSSLLDRLDLDIMKSKGLHGAVQGHFGRKAW